MIKQILTGIGIFLLVALVILLLVGVGFALVTGVAVGLGWLLRWAFPVFSFFESTLLGAIFGCLTFYFLRWLALNFLPSEMLEQSSDNHLRGPNRRASDEDEKFEYKTIPETRFYKSEADRTWEAWLREEVANDIYSEFQETPRAVSTLNDSQVQELAIRLTDAAIQILKRKTGRARKLSMSLGDFKRELTRLGQRAYDDAILQLAVEAVNMNLEFYQSELTMLLQTQAWDRPALVSTDEEE